MCKHPRRLSLFRVLPLLLLLILALVRVAWAELFNDIRQFNKGSGQFEAISPTTPPPAPRHAHAAATSQDKMLVFFGASPEGTPLSDVWEYDPATNAWSELTAVGPFKPEPRSHHSAVTLPDGDVFIFGGLTQTSGGLSPSVHVLADLFLYHARFKIWSPRGKTPEEPNPPGPRYGHSAVLLRDKVIIWGGHDGTGPLDDMWAFDPETDEWTRGDQGVNTPPARTLHATAKKDDSLWVFGGEGTNGDELEDTWEFTFSEGLVPSVSSADMAPGHWIERAPMPAALVNASAATFTDADGQLKILVYGGRRGGEIVGDAFLYDVATNIWQVLELPQPASDPRAGHTLVTIKNEVFLFGGERPAVNRALKIW